MEWYLQPGDKIKRTDLHERFGGRRQGGIGPSAKSPNVFVFTDAASGKEHGYTDRWDSDGSFLYTGEGQVGDQVMKQGNAAILNHKDQGRSLRLFSGARGTVTYEGEFSVDDQRPWFLADAPETGGGPIRKVIVFRLRQV